MLCHFSYGKVRKLLFKMPLFSFLIKLGRSSLCFVPLSLLKDFIIEHATQGRTQECLQKAILVTRGRSGNAAGPSPVYDFW
jgi:hypothetical protein